jgi:drug/metabolite transporter (DMT)-like permease
VVDDDDVHRHRDSLRGAGFRRPDAGAGELGYLVVSALLHTGYNLFLVRTYRSGDLGQTYPIARGSSPLLVSLGAAIFAGELPDPISMAGVLLVSAGIISLAFQGRKLGIDSLLYALGTGCFIGAYSVTDGIGARLSGVPIGYTIWMCLLWGLTMPPVYAILLAQPDPRSARNMGGGGRRRSFAGRLWHHHRCDVARSDGPGVGAA